MSPLGVFFPGLHEPPLKLSLTKFEKGTTYCIIQFLYPAVLEMCNILLFICCFQANLKKIVSKYIEDERICVGRNILQVSN